ncbi:hypothetical protein Btru_062216 [Bulinus truncatus]|nr:hypothetical protein Btru_062216 [Bulinus truncatus]
MDLYLRWRGGTKRNEQHDPWKLHPINIGLCLVFGFLLVSMVYVHWGTRRYTRLADTIWGPATANSARQGAETRPGLVPIQLVACLVITAMISILHVAFKWPFFSSAAVDGVPCGGTEVHSRHPMQESHQCNQRSPIRETSDKSNSDGRCSDEGVDNLSSLNEIIKSLTAQELSPLDVDQSVHETTPLLSDETLMESSNDTVQKQEDVLITCNGGAHCQISEYMYGEAQIILDNDISLSNASADCPAENINAFDIGTQTDEFVSRCDVVDVGTMTCGHGMMDVSVNTHQRLCKIVKNCGTSTTGPFMKKLRRAQRLLNEADVKTRLERQEKVAKWRSVMDRYKDKLCKLFENLEKKDRLLGYTALNRALSENEVKEICTAVRSSRDRLITQCKLNSALKEVIESKSELPPAVATPNHQQVCR